MDNISIIIPVFNSEKTIEKVVDEIIDELSGKSIFKIVLVNDGSIDKSYYKCKELSEKYGFLKFVNLSKNFGQHSAILAGLNYVTDEYIVFMDDDLQTPARGINKLVDKIKEDFDVVYARYPEKKHGFLKNIGSRFKNIIFRRLLPKSRNVTSSSFFAMRKYLVKELLNYRGPYPYLPGMIFCATKNITNIEIQHRTRPAGSSNYSFNSLLRLWFNGFTNYSTKPLRISFFLGLIFSIIGFLFSIVFIIQRFLDPSVFLGWAFIIVAILIFSGVQLIMIGLVGEYIGRIFLSQNKQPQYVIREEFNTGDMKNVTSLQ